MYARMATFEIPPDTPPEREHMESAEPFFEAMAPVVPDNPGRRTDVGHFEVVLDQPVAATA